MLDALLDADLITRRNDDRLPGFELTHDGIAVLGDEAKFELRDALNLLARFGDALRFESGNLHGDLVRADA